MRLFSGLYESKRMMWINVGFLEIERNEQMIGVQKQKLQGLEIDWIVSVGFIYGMLSIRDFIFRMFFLVLLMDKFFCFIFLGKVQFEI